MTNILLWKIMMNRIFLSIFYKLYHLNTYVWLFKYYLSQKSTSIYTFLLQSILCAKSFYSESKRPSSQDIPWFENKGEEPQAECRCSTRTHSHTHFVFKQPKSHKKMIKLKVWLLHLCATVCLSTQRRQEDHKPPITRLTQDFLRTHQTHTHTRRAAAKSKQEVQKLEKNCV